MIASRLIDLLKSVDAIVGRPAARLLRGATRDLPPSPRDVLVIRLWGLGNLVLLAPLLRNQGGRRVRLLTLTRNAAFARRHLPGVELLGLPLPTSPGFPAAAWAIARRLRRERPDVIVDAETFLRLPALLARCAGGAPVVGLDTPGQGRRALLDRPVAYDPTRHVALTYASLFAAAHLPASLHGSPLRTDLADPADARRVAQGLGLRLDGPLVLLHPGSGDHFPGRRWPASRFGALAAALGRDGLLVGVTGSHSERDLAKQVVAASGSTAVSLAGRVAGDGLADLVALASLVVSNDTGPLHLADALGVPVVGLFGPNTPHRYGPRRPGSVALFADLPCSPCLDDRLAKRSACRSPACMDALSVAAVLAACRHLLRHDPASPRERAVAVHG